MRSPYAKLINSENLILSIYVQPCASKTEIVGIHGSYLKVRVQTRPLDGKANREILDFIMRVFNLKRKQLSLISGEKSRYKLVNINCEVEIILAKLQEILNGTTKSYN